MNQALPPLASIHTVAFDFDGVFTDNKVYVDQDGREMVCCDRRDGLAFDFVRTFQRRGRLDVDFFILSKEANPVVLARARKLKLTCHHAVGDKLRFVRDHLAARFPDVKDPLAGMVFAGNDLNDIPLMRAAGFSVAPADAHPRVKAIANLVLGEAGGDAFVRALLERLLDIQHLSNEEIDELVSDR